MAYEKQTWTCGETITADKLNHIEDGIMESGGGSSLIVNMIYDATNDCYTLDKTWQEIRDTAASGGLVYAKIVSEGFENIDAVMYIGGNSLDNDYSVDFYSDLHFTTSSPSGYPTTCLGGGDTPK